MTQTSSFIEAVPESGVAGTVRLPVPRRYLVGGLAAAALSAASGVAAVQVSGNQALALAALAGVALAAAAVLFARFSGRGRLEAVITEAVNKSAEATFVTAVPTDRSQPFIYANPAFHGLFKGDGEAISTPGALAGLLDRPLNGDDNQQLEEFSRLEAALNASVPGHAVLAFRSTGGDIDWRRISVVPFSGGRYALWRAEDVTAERELDMVRRHEDEMLADFLDNLPAGFFSIDTQGRIQYANSVFVDWLGVPLDEMRARDMRFSDFVVAANSEAKTTDRNGDDGDVTLRGSGDTLFKACLVQSEQTGGDGEMQYSRSILLRDLTWRGTAGQGSGSVSTTASHRLRWLFDEAPVGIVLLDLQGEVTDVNRAFLKLLGVHRDTVVGRPFPDRINKEDQGDVAAQLSKVVMGIMPASHLEVRMPAMGERELVASLYASRLEDDSGEVSGLVLHFIDTTEQKNLEVQFAQSQKMQAVGQLAGGVAHDFNNLLTAMIGFSDLLLDRHGPDDPSFSDIMQIKQNANRATNLVRQLLAFSRQQTLEPTVIEVTEVLSDLSNLLGRLIGENIELQMTHERDLWLLLFDRGQFDQVIINLAVNARDAMPGGGALTIRTSNVSVEQAVQRGHDVMAAGDYVLIVVSDTGVGIAKEDMSRIFEPFFSTKEVGAGTGLGLSTVYGIIHQAEGHIYVDSAPGDGTTFSLYLPRHIGARAAGEISRQEARAQDAAANLPLENGDLTGEGTVLLVEDEDAVRMFGARALRNKGYRVLEACNGEEALDVINSTDDHVDLIISDVVMPGMDGHTLVKLLLHEQPHLKIILMSGYSEDVFAEDIDDDASIEFLAKPFSLKDLAGKVKDVLDR